MSTMAEAGLIPEWTQGDRLGKALRARGISNQDMADLLGVSRNTIGNYIHDKRKVPMAVLGIWAAYTEVPLEWLVTGVAPGFDGDDPTGLARDSVSDRAPLAQLAEQLTLNQRVEGVIHFPLPAANIDRDYRKVA